MGGGTGVGGKRAEVGRPTDLVEETGWIGLRKRDVTESAAVFAIFKIEIVSQKGASQKRVSRTEISFSNGITTNPRPPIRILGWLIAPTG